MTTSQVFHDSLYRLQQIGQTIGVQLIRITELDEDNRYTARPIEFDASGETQFAGEETLVVTNLAEPADQSGEVPAGSEAIALDLEGRWVVFLAPASDEEETSGGCFPAEVIASLGNAAYTVREQSPTGAGTFAGKGGTQNVTAYNLAELSLGPGAAVDTGEIVLVKSMADTGSPTTTRFFFDHPAYAKYLN